MHTGDAEYGKLLNLKMRKFENEIQMIIGLHEVGDSKVCLRKDNLKI